MKKKFILGNYYLNNLKQFVTFDPGDLDLCPSDPKINRVPLLPRMDVWTNFEEGRSGVLELLIRNEKVTDGLTYGHVQSNMHSLL